MFPLLSFYADL